MKKNFLAILLVGLLSVSCVSTKNGTNQNAVLGSGIGAVGGAILGQALGRNTGATIIGGALGAVLGYAVAMQVDSQTNQVQGAGETRAMVDSAKRNEPVLEVRQKTLAPTDHVKPGESLTVKVTYIVFDERLTAQPVKETKSIWHNGEMVKVLGESEVVRENGTYESLVSFKLPGEIEKGTYEVRHNINTNTLAINSTVQFTVI